MVNGARVGGWVIERLGGGYSLVIRIYQDGEVNLNFCF